VVKTLDVLEALWQAEGAGVTDLTERTGLAKSTVHAHLTTLRSKGYVVQEGDEYRLSLRFLSFGEHVKHAEPLYAASDAPIAEFADETGNECSVRHTRTGSERSLTSVRGLVRSRATSTSGRTPTSTILPAARAMLAHFSEERVNEIVDEWGLPAFSEKTITDRETLFEELQTVRDEGVAYTRGEYLPGINAIGAPILDTDGTVYGAVSVAGPQHQLENKWEKTDFQDQLLSTANTIEVNMMFS